MKARSLAVRSALFAVAALAAAAADVSSRPALAQDPPAAPAASSSPQKLLPDSVDFVTSNGMRVFLVADHEVPLVAFQVRFRGGSVEDPAGREGAAAIAADLLMKGAGARDVKQFQEDLEFVGGTMSAGAAHRHVLIGAEFLKGDLDLAFSLLGDVVLRPRFDADEFAQSRKQAIDAITSSRDEPQQLIGRYMAGWLFGIHPYGRAFSGDETSLAALTHDDVKAAAARMLAPSRMWIAVAGDFEPADMRKRIETAFGGWESKAAPAADIPAWGGSEGGRLLLVDKPGAIQTYFRFGNKGIDESHPDHPARTLANTILGGRFTSRLNKVLRTEKGLTYGANSVFDDDRQGMFFVATYTETPRTEECMTIARDIYTAFREKGLTAEELTSARNYVKGQFATSNVETGEQQAARILDLAFDGLPREIVSKYFERLDLVSLDDVNRVIRESFPAKLDWTVIGDAAAIGEICAKLGKVTRVSITDPGFATPSAPR